MITNNNEKRTKNEILKTTQ